VNELPEWLRFFGKPRRGSLIEEPTAQVGGEILEPTPTKVTAAEPGDVQTGDPPPGLPTLQKRLEIGGRYSLSYRLGRGSVGEVWAARDELLDFDVALKILRPDIDPSLSHLLRHEARVALQLDHPNVCRAHHYGVMDGYTVLVMQLLEGEDLNRRRRRREGSRIPMDEVLLAGIDGATGLRHAHQQGVLHNDLKPANLFYTHVGKVKLMDFGLPRLGRHKLLGTPGYLDPQRLKRRDPGPWSDIFSLGATLYTLAVGDQPFGTGEQAMVRALEEPLPRSELLPDGLYDILASCMHPDIAARPSLDRLIDGFVSLALTRGLTLTDAFSEEPSWGSEEQPLWVEAGVGAEFVGVPATQISWNESRIAVPRFLMARNPVTRGEYARFVAQTGWRVPDGWPRSGIPDGHEDHPVTGVTLADAQGYARWAGARLPTTAEWLAALHGDENRRFPWGDRCRPDLCFCPLSNATGTRSVDEGAGTTTPEGVKHLLGNVWEWTERSDDAPPRRETDHWIAGGSFRNPCGQARGARPLTAVAVHHAFDHLGFRLAKDA